MTDQPSQWSHSLPPWPVRGTNFQYYVLLCCTDCDSCMPTQNASHPGKARMHLRPAAGQLELLVPQFQLLRPTFILSLCHHIIRSSGGKLPKRSHRQDQPDPLMNINVYYMQDPDTLEAAKMDTQMKSQVLCRRNLRIH